MKTVFQKYLNTFSGLSQEVWWLACVTLINRASTMVIPFLLLYLKKSLSFSLENVAWIMSCFGLGSVMGNWLGGKLTDKIGYYKAMVGSLFISGIFFIVLQYLSSFLGFCVGIFLVMLTADAFRPALFAALNAYSKTENMTRSVTLIRLAINLGFFASPAVGSLLIVAVGYLGMFWVDGIICMLASFLLLFVLHSKKALVIDENKVENPSSAYKDKAYWMFFIAMFLFGFTFLQYFSTIPLYYKEHRMLSEFEIGLLMGFNGFFIFLLQMPLTKWLEDLETSKIKLVTLGLFLVTLSFTVLNLTGWFGVLIIGILLMTVGGMIAFPFSNAFAVERAKKGKQGEYMALYSISFSLSHIFSHNIGMQFIAKFGYENTWFFITFLSLVGVVVLLILHRMLQKERLETI